MTLTANVPHEAWNPAPQPSLEVEGVTVAYPNGNVALRDATSVSYTHLTLPTIYSV